MFNICLTESNINGSASLGETVFVIGALNHLSMGDLRFIEVRGRTVPDLPDLKVKALCLKNEYGSYLP